MRAPRRIVAVDRTVLTLIGFALAAGGGLLLALGTGWVGAPATLDKMLDQRLTTEAIGASWWAGACAAAALALVSVGLWWLLAHRPGPRTTQLTLPGSRTGNRLRIQPDAVSRAAATVLEADPQVRDATLTLRTEHGRLVLVGRVRVAPRADLTILGSLLDEVTHHVGQVLGRPITGRIRLAVARRGSAESILR